MTSMSPRQRLVTALDRGVPDRLPVTTHHVMPYFLEHYLGGADNDAFFERFGLDPIVWTCASKPDAARGEYLSPEGHFSSDAWRLESDDEVIPEGLMRHFRLVTPRGTLTAELKQVEWTSWLLEPLVKEKRDIDLIGEFMTMPVCDAEAIKAEDARIGQRALLRGGVTCFEIMGQPGCWQDAACLVGIQKLIMATYTDPEWVHELLRIVQRRKLHYLESLRGVPYDVLELGGGDASSTVISPALFDDFVAPYDGPLIARAHELGQRIAYHTCGGMMPILERLAAMKPDAIETLTPPGMGGDMRLAEAKRRVGDQVCMIGGFDQFHFFTNCTPEETRAEVRRCFAEAGPGGGFILSPSDHFFDCDLELVAAFADEARRCTY